MDREVDWPVSRHRAGLPGDARPLVFAGRPAPPAPFPAAFPAKDRLRFRGLRGQPARGPRPAPTTSRTARRPTSRTAVGRPAPSAPRAGKSPIASGAQAATPKDGAHRRPGERDDGVRFPAGARDGTPRGPPPDPPSPPLATRSASQSLAEVGLRARREPRAVPFQAARAGADRPRDLVERPVEKRPHRSRDCAAGRCARNARPRPARAARPRRTGRCWTPGSLSSAPGPSVGTGREASTTG